MHSVRGVLQSKGSQVWSTYPDATVYDALKMMSEKEIGALVVLDDGHLVGIFSERDYARKVILLGKTARDTLVRDIMTPKVYSVRPDQTIEECMHLMTDRHIRHLPVVEDDEVVGVISIGDVVKTIISEQKFVIEQLENYISGDR